MNIERTGRGFQRTDFKDCYGVGCSLVMEDARCNNANPKVSVPKIPCEMPEDYLLTTHPNALDTETSCLIYKSLRDR